MYVSEGREFTDLFLCSYETCVQEVQRYSAAQNAEETVRSES